MFGELKDIPLIVCIVCGIIHIDVVTSTETCVCLKNFTKGLYNPVHIEFKGESFYIAEQRGILRYFASRDDNGSVLLDISDRVLKASNPFNEQGLLGFALHPGYFGNGKVYVFYMAELGTKKFTQLSEFTVNNNVIHPSTERFIMRIEKQSNAGNGGQLFFGHDGFLYISVGDGVGDVGETQDSAQDPSSLLGKILRIDVDAQSFSNGAALSYGIPPNNPFVNKPRGVRRSSHMVVVMCGAVAKTDYPINLVGQRRIFCGDPGARAYEEINIIRAGKNYGWDVMEGLKCYDKSQCARGSLENEELPIHVYKHTSLHHAVVGGYVYRGHSIPALTTRYVFGDALNGTMSILTEEEGTWSASPLTLCDPELCPCDAREKLRPYIMAFGQDTKGEVYVLTTTTFTITVNDGIALKMVAPTGHTTTCGARHSTSTFGHVLALSFVLAIMLIGR